MVSETIQEGDEGRKCVWAVEVQKGGGQLQRANRETLALAIADAKDFDSVAIKLVHVISQVPCGLGMEMDVAAVDRRVIKQYELQLFHSVVQPLVEFASTKKVAVSYLPLRRSKREAGLAEAARKTGAERFYIPLKKGGVQSFKGLEVTMLGGCLLIGVREGKPALQVEVQSLEQLLRAHDHSQGEDGSTSPEYSWSVTESMIDLPSINNGPLSSSSDPDLDVSTRGKVPLSSSSLQLPPLDSADSFATDFSRSRSASVGGPSSSPGRGKQELTMATGSDRAAVAKKRSSGSWKVSDGLKKLLARGQNSQRGSSMEVGDLANGTSKGKGAEAGEWEACQRSSGSIQEKQMPGGKSEGRGSSGCGPAGSGVGPTAAVCGRPPPHPAQQAAAEIARLQAVCGRGELAGEADSYRSASGGYSSSAWSVGNFWSSQGIPLSPQVGAGAILAEHAAEVRETMAALGRMHVTCGAPAEFLSSWPQPEAEEGLMLTLRQADMAAVHTADRAAPASGWTSAAVDPGTGPGNPGAAPLLPVLPPAPSTSAGPVGPITFVPAQVAAATSGWRLERVLSSSPVATLFAGEIHGCPVLVAQLAEWDWLDPLAFMGAVGGLMGVPHSRVAFLMGACPHLRTLVYGSLGGDNLLSHHLGRQPPLPGHRRLAIIAQVCRGLLGLHNGELPPYFAGCLRPEHVAVNANGDARICLAGAATLAKDEGAALRWMGDAAGTPSAAAASAKVQQPCREGSERSCSVVEGEQRVQSDTQALGVLMLQLVFHTVNRDKVLTLLQRCSVAEDIDEAVDMVCRAATEEVPNQSPALPKHMLQGLAQLALECCDSAPEWRPSLAHVSAQLQTLMGAPMGPR